MSSLAGKVAFVTGGSRGIGAAIVRRLAEDGADVAFTYLGRKDAAAEVLEDVQGFRRCGLAIQADSLDAAAVRSAIAAAVSQLGGLDILVNSAGVLRAGVISDLTLEDFDISMAVNVRAAFVASQAAAAVMGEGGRIISIGSNLAVRAPRPGLVAYTASKAALAGLTQALARDLGPRGITVNIVHPGSTNTDMNPATGPRAASQVALMATTSGYADPADVARVVAHLASAGAGSVTGAAWTIDNGANA